ncbi:uncharacterized protein L969DRAFT_47628 [Mixia osmundae IAM 14324]|uniref:Zn(2)-C6 fungal-type domain-containing protein n=1 Tax=Mixia osmundae (strain CBS 9802 / IAM 14324 / JCM 22182 / KY 12970) TaxID=764103 RepID=G7E990_MIXOS|nr:uncharacterized protein L969DRAFT_47628 [Mixia osmundae IAM 14324]KEI39832.1 hypothetical protein L969DRAFT_47628 [Mixia osmundae IAM 14324]GAA99209.1 hypothetical protein E5Q_05902 [Mixia osmundae IAM 14324]
MSDHAHEHSLASEPVGYGNNQFAESAMESTINSASPLKRSTRACTACRKGKNRCEGMEDPPCKRCKAGNLECKFERPLKDSQAGLSQRVIHLETHIEQLQNQNHQLIQHLDALEKFIQQALPKFKTTHPVTVGAALAGATSAAPAAEGVYDPSLHQVSSYRDSDDLSTSNGNLKRARIDQKGGFDVLAEAASQAAPAGPI